MLDVKQKIFLELENNSRLDSLSFRILKSLLFQDLKSFKIRTYTSNTTLTIITSRGAMEISSSNDNLRTKFYFQTLKYIEVQHTLFDVIYYVFENIPYDERQEEMINNYEELISNSI